MLADTKTLHFITGARDVGVDLIGDQYDAVADDFKSNGVDGAAHTNELPLQLAARQFIRTLFYGTPSCQLYLIEECSTERLTSASLAP